MSSASRTKRRRAPEEAIVDEGTPKSAKRQRIIVKEDPSDFLLQCRKILEDIMLIRSSDGRIVCDSLFKAPSKRLNPEYYQVVAHPIDIARIQQKLASEEYGTPKEFFDDVALLIDNQKKFYEEGDTEYTDAKIIWEMFQQERVKTFGGSLEVPSSQSPVPSMSSARSSTTRQSRNCDSVERWMLEALLVSLVELTDSDGRLLSPPFRLLPRIPEYYAKIKQPIDMKTIAQKIRDGTYSTWDDIEKDVTLLCKNAKKFNEAGSEIHKDADALLRYFNTRKGELMRLKRGFGKASLERHKEVVDELLDSEAGQSPELSEDSEEDDDTENSDDPLWILYWTVRNAKTSSTSSEDVLCEPFLELPNRSYYPDYYDEIEKPISLFMINKRLKAREYTVESLVEDMNTMFDNAKSYNSDGSNIFKAADKLQNTLRDKAGEFCSSRKSSPTKKSLTKRKTTESPNTAALSPMNGGSKSPAKRMQFDQLVSRYRDRLMSVWNVIRDHTDKGRATSNGFLYLPCEKTYPDYYEVIKNPIDLTMIKQRIEENKYSSSNKMYLEIKLMCDNARTYNEQDSPIYADASIIESVAVAALKTISTSTIFSPLNRTPRSKTGEGPFSKARKALKVGETSEPKRRRTGETVTANGVLSVQRPVQYRSTDEEKMWKLFCTINEFKSPTGQLLASAFAKLPSRMEYPEYYNVIKKPLDLHRIYAKLSGGYYSDLRALIADFRLLFENACKFNEPDSAIYKEAFYMQRVLMVTSADMIQTNSSGTPSVQMEVRMILTELLVAVCTHADIDGKCYSDALVDIHEVFERNGIKKSEFPFSLDELKTHIQKGRYRRLDRFQEDIFNLFAKAREVTASSSRIFKSTVEMQLFFIQKRDELCRNRLDSPAIFFNDTHLKREISTMQREKNVKVEEEEAGEESISRKPETDVRESQKTERDLSSKVEVDVVQLGEIEYRAEDYCYVSRADDSTTQPHIMRIEKLYKDEDEKDGGFLIYGFWCYRPRETYHLVTRRFYPNEVFLTPFTDTVVSNRLQGRCLVMYVEDYLKKKPIGFEEKDVFACEQRYLGRQLHFKRLRTWPHAKDFKNKIELIDREEQLKPEKVPSDFAKADDKEATDEAESNETNSSHQNKFPHFFDIEREEVILERKAEASTSEGKPRTFYEQMCHRDKWYRLGDCVLVFNAKKPFCDIFRIGCLWRTTNEKGVEESFFSGVWFARPREIKHEKSQTYYRREVIAIDQPDVIEKMDNIQAKCAVLVNSFYAKSRPTEIPECDVFLVEHRVAGKEASNGKCSLFSKPTFEKVSTHIEDSSTNPEESQCNGGSTPSSSNASIQEDTYPLDMRSARPLKRLRNCTSTRTVDDEVLYLKTTLVMEKQMSPLMVKTDAELPIENRDLDKEASAMKNPAVTPGTSTGSGETTPSKDLAAWLAVQPKLNSKSKSGYILFSAEIRKRIMNENPEAGFGEVSKIVGIEWKKLNDEEKKQYEVRAQYISDERAKLAASTPSQKALQPGQVRVFICKWQLCDWQFDCEEGLYDHMKTAHTSQIVDGENQYVCLWATCLKYRKEGKPFPSLPRLHRHIKEKHLPSAARPIYPNQRNKNYYVYQPPNLTNATPSAAAQMTGKFINHPYGMPPAATPATTQSGSTAVIGQQIVINGHPQTIPAGHTVVQTGGVPPRVINAQMSVKQVLRVMPSTSSTQAAPTIVYSTAAPGQSIPAGSNVQYVQQQQQYSSDPSTSQQVQQIHHSQPVYVLQEPPRRPEPVFVPAPNSVQVKRVLHSEIYLRYIESMSHGKRQRHVSKWDRNLSTNPRNSLPTRVLPYHWLKGANLQGERPREDDVVRGLWRLRDDMLTSTLNIERQIEPSKW